MKSEAEVRKMWEREARCFLRSGHYNFLEKMSILSDVLEMDSHTEQVEFLKIQEDLDAKSLKEAADKMMEIAKRR